MSLLETILFHAWYGPVRRLFRAVLHRIYPWGATILSGPLKGWFFSGPELPCRLGIYELHVQHTLRELLRPGDVFYDLGANNGYLSLLAASCAGESGRVYSFEPLPQNVERIDQLMALNGVTNQQTIRQAVSGQAGEMQLYLGSEVESYTSSLIRNRRTSEITVEVTTLNDFAASHRPPDLIKMDVEGAEVQVLEGAGTLLSEHPPRHWLIEVHSPQLDREVQRILGQYGYRIEGLTVPYARKEYPRHLLAGI